jgi:AcrR family transcriptional regulator
MGKTASQKLSDDPDGTRSALLSAATESFAEHGMRLARVRDIATRAGANLAAINYHFGSKEGLYLAVLQAQAEATVRRFPIAPSNPDPSAPPQQLEAAIRSLLSRFLAADASSLLPKLMTRELSHPTAALETMVKTFARPQFAQLSSVVGQVLGPGASPEQVRLGAFSVLGQCMFYLFARPIAERLAPEVYRGNSVDRLARHIAGFSIGGLSALRKTAIKEKHA